MKPTEADIQAELDRHGLGFEIGNYRSDDGSFYLRHATCEYKIHAKLSERSFEIWTLDGMRLLREFNFDDVSSDRIVDVKPPTITVNASHWTSALALCRDLVRLITGEQVEKTLEGKVREILEPLGPNIDIVSCSQSCVEIKGTTTRFKVFHDRIEATYRGNPETETIVEYQENTSHMCEWRKALPAIAALLTEQPEQTLEEAVRGQLKGITYDNLFVSDDVVCFDRYNNHDPIQYVISKEWAFSGVAGDLKKTDPREDVTGREGFDGIHLAVHNIAALLSTRSTKPSYSDLEQRVEELEKEVSKRNGKVSVLEHQLKASRERAEYLENQNAELFKQNARLIRERDEAESKLQDCPTEKDMEDFEQLYDREMASKNRTIERLHADKEQLQDSVDLYRFALEQSIRKEMEASQ